MNTNAKIPNKQQPKKDFHRSKLFPSFIDLMKATKPATIRIKCCGFSGKETIPSIPQIEINKY